jgi:very-short-patch-repair endonuclease
MMANEFARQLRRDMTDAERCLWKYLRAHRFANQKVRRQEPIGSYIIDFVSHRSRLSIELDGGQHAVQVQHDRERTRWLESRGYRVVRFWNNQVLTETESVLEAIALALAPSPY